MPKKLILILTFAVLLLAAFIAIAQKAPTAPNPEIISPSSTEIKPIAAIAVRLCDQLLGFIVVYPDGATETYEPDSPVAYAVIPLISKEHIETLSLGSRELCKPPTET